MTPSSTTGDVAIIGMACMFPGAPNLDAYWQNIVNKVDAITDPPPEAWDASIFFDPDSTANDRVYCKRGGYLGPLAEFNPFDYGIMPVGLDGGEPDQWLALKIAQDALVDAGYLERLKSNPDERHRTAVILGKGTYLNRGNLNMVQHSLVVDQTLQTLRTLHPEYSAEDLQLIRQELKRKLPPFNAEAAPGLVPNIVAGRIANRLDLMGPTYTVDAACASSLIAIETAMRELLTTQCDLALAGGAQVTTPIPILTLFCQLNALSRRQEIRPFDTDADGTILGEGLGIIVLKRREDAERDGDRIYAFIKGVGTASDGRATGVLAPRVEGEELALRRAYAIAGVSPETVGLVEAHGTGTAAGDLAEIQALQRVFGRQEGRLPHCALGTVKSMIGHTMPAAGIASVIKTALALHHKVLPPTLHCDKPNPKLELEKTACYINTETRPWIHGAASGHTPRRAGVNAFGFGGINAHVVLEENPDPDEARSISHLRRWESEVVVVEADTRERLIERAQRLETFLAASPEVELLDVAYTLNTELHGQPYRLSLVAQSPGDLQQKLAQALRRLAKPGSRQIKDVKGIYFFETPFYPAGQLAFLFPGEGSQYPNMLSDLCLHFPEVRACFDRIDRIFTDHPRGYLPSDFIFPRPTFGRRDEMEKHLWGVEGAIEAVLTANQALFTLLSQIGIRPEVMVGHSTGDYSAMRAAGIIPLSDAAFIGEHVLELNRIYSEQVEQKNDVPRAVLLAVGAGHDRVTAITEQVGGQIHVGLDNCPHQTVIVGEKSAIEAAADQMRSQGLIYETLTFDRAYHTPLFTPYSQPLQGFIERLPLSSQQRAQTRLYSCTTAAPYPDAVAEIRALAMEHWLKPVRFRETIQAMYADGARLFVEVGARGNLTSFVDDILREQPHLAVPANTQHRSGLSQLNHLLGLLSAQRVPMRLDYLYQRRQPRKISFESAEKQTAGQKKPGGTLKLATGWAGMEISPEVAARLRKYISPPGPAPADEGVHLSPASGAPEANPTPPVLMASTHAGGARQEMPTEAAPIPPASYTAAQDSDHVGRGSTKPPTSAGEQALRDARARVVQAHLQLMEQFLDGQQAVMQQFIMRATSRRQDPPLPTAVEGKVSGRPHAPEMPFIRTIRSLAPGQELSALCTLDLSEDLFLKDHTLGRAISSEDNELLALPIVPLTISMEIMAEAAAVLLPSQILTGMRNVRAYRWIVLENETLTLQVVAKRKSPPRDQEVEVYLREAEAEASAKTRPPIMEGTLIFGSAYPEPPEPDLVSVPVERPSRWTPGQLYAEGMFHGPAFQAVASVDHSGEAGAIATLQTLPTHQFFRSRPDPAFVAEPVILDAAGQVVGFWTMEHLQTGFVVFPFRLERLDLYGPPLRWPEQVTCQAQINLHDGGHVRSNIGIWGPDGRLRLQLAGWEDKRFDLPRRFYHFLLSPKEKSLSEPWAAPLKGFQDTEALQCCRVTGFPEEFFEAHGEFWEKVLAHVVLSRAERQAWRRLKGPKRRRVDWLLGRVAAKDAIRLLVQKAHGLTLCPADVEIVADERGRPGVQGAWLKKVTQPIVVSLAHTEGVAVAVAGHAMRDQKAQTYGLGIDIERVSRQSHAFEGVALTPAEQAKLAAMGKRDVEAWPLRLWCAKEAVGKALGQGLVGGPLGVVAKEIDVNTGIMQMNLAGEMARLFPEINGQSITAYTVRDGDFVVASVLGDGRGQ